MLLPALFVQEFMRINTASVEKLRAMDLKK